MTRIRAIDLFCGAGGSSWGARKAGVKIVAAFDAWELAGKVYKDNFPGTKFYPGKLEHHNPRKLKKQLGRIDLIMASPECTNHSPAKGNRPRCEKSKNTAFQVIRFAKVFKPRWIIIENVVSMQNWSRYDKFIRKLQKLKYSVTPQVLKATDFGVPQSRRRLFILCDRKKEAPEVIPTTTRPRTVNDFIDRNGTYPYSLLRAKNRAKATLKRANRAIRTLGKNKPFLLVYYGSDHGGGWQKLNMPLRTITTLDRFAFVKPSKRGHLMRMLQVPELRAAMGMLAKKRLRYGTRREQIKMMGNAVCPPVMGAAIKTMLQPK